IFSFHTKTKKLVNLIQSKDLDEGNLCISPLSTYVSYSVQSEQVFSDDKFNKLFHYKAFKDCIFKNNETLYGINPKNQLYKCSISRKRCQALSVPLESFVKF